MRRKDRLRAWLDGVGHMFAGSILTLVLLHISDRGDFSREMGIVTFVGLPLFAASIWIRWREGGDVEGASKALSIHEVIAGVSGMIAAALFGARYGLGLEAIGFWYALPLLFFYIACVADNREESETAR